MRVPCVIFYGLIPMTDADGVFLPVVLDTPLDKIYRRLSITTTA